MKIMTIQLHFYGFKRNKVKTCTKSTIQLRSSTLPLDGSKHLGPHGSLHTASVEAKAGYLPTMLHDFSCLSHKNNQQVANNRVITHHFPHTLMNRRLSRLQIRVTQSPRTRTEITAVSPVQVPSFVIGERRLHNQRFHQNFLVSLRLRAQMASYTCRRTLQTGVEPFSAYI